MNWESDVAPGIGWYAQADCMETDISNVTWYSIYFY